MKISIITDEISSDPETAIELGVAWGVHDFELRGFFTDRAPRFSDYQKQRLRDLLAEHQARIVAIGPGLFKMAFPAQQAPRAALGWMDRNGYESWSEAIRAVQYHLNELLPESLDYANELGAHLVVIFGFAFQTQKIDPGTQAPGLLWVAFSFYFCYSLYFLETRSNPGHSHKAA